MKTSLPGLFWRILSAKGLTPVVIGVFLMLYIGIAFTTEDALMALIALAGSNIMLIALFALIPVNRCAYLIEEVRRHLARRKLLRGKMQGVVDPLFDETVKLEAGEADFSAVSRRLAASGYHVAIAEDTLAVWRGVSTIMVRTLFLAAGALLFSGVLISLSSRENFRGTVIEGVRLPNPAGGESGGIVNRILLTEVKGLFLAKSLSMEIAPAQPGDLPRVFGLYPPARNNGLFVYPRYLGVGLNYRFIAPDLPVGYEAHSFLSIYPPGKEASEEIPGSPYRIVFSLAPSDDGSDPYETGRMTFLFKLLKGKDVVLTGKAPTGGDFSQGGYGLSFPDSRRLVITDFIHDPGVFLIWVSMMLFVVSVVFWLPIRIFSPRREMLFTRSGGECRAWCRAEGKRRMHTGVFHEALDVLESL